MERKYGSAGAVDVTFVATDGTASGGVDFDSVVDTIHWNDGEQGIKTDVVNIHRNNSVSTNLTVTLQLAVPGALASSVALENATLLILNNNGTPPASTNLSFLRSLVGTTNWIPTNTASVFITEGTGTTYTNLSSTASDELFFMQDGASGIAVFFGSGTNQFMPQAGDRLRVCGTLTNINGQLTLASDFNNASNYVWRLSSSNALPSSVALDFTASGNTAVMEAIEGALASAANVRISLAGGSNFPSTNATIFMTNLAGNVFGLTINPNTDIAGKSIPQGMVSVTGVLAQNDSSAPYTTNYSLLPTRYADFTSGTPGGDVQPQAMLQVFLNMAVFEMTPQAAIEQPRFASSSFPGSSDPHTYSPRRMSMERRFTDEICCD